MTTGYASGNSLRPRLSKKAADGRLRLMARVIDRAVRDCASSDETRRKEAAEWIFREHSAEEEWSLRWCLERLSALSGGRGPGVRTVRRRARAKLENSS
jgi:hypothetical protein